jgi:hypothetical protein
VKWIAKMSIQRATFAIEFDASTILAAKGSLAHSTRKTCVLQVTTSSLQAQEFAEVFVNVGDEGSKGVVLDNAMLDKLEDKVPATYGGGSSAFLGKYGNILYMIHILRIIAELIDLGTGVL